jgi:hypothetical protein
MADVTTAPVPACEVFPPADCAVDLSGVKNRFIHGNDNTPGCYITNYVLGTTCLMAFAVIVLSTRIDTGGFSFRGLDPNNSGTKCFGGWKGSVSRALYATARLLAGVSLIMGGTMHRDDTAAIVETPLDLKGVFHYDNYLISNECFEEGEVWSMWARWCTGLGMSVIASLCVLSSVFEWFHSARRGTI